MTGKCCSTTGTKAHKAVARFANPALFLAFAWSSGLNAFAFSWNSARTIAGDRRGARVFDTAVDLCRRAVMVGACDISADRVTSKTHIDLDGAASAAPFF
jgi:hypothetical protein